MSEEKIFAKGLFIKQNPNDPEFVIAKAGINVKEFSAWLQEHQNENGYVNIDMLLGRSGNPYAALNTWQPKESDSSNKTSGESEDKVPF